MLRSKKAASSRTKPQKHDNQNTRVAVDRRNSKKKGRKGDRSSSLCEIVKSVVIRQSLLDLWENRIEYWERVCDAAGKLFEGLGS